MDGAKAIAVAAMRGLERVAASVHQAPGQSSAWHLTAASVLHRAVLTDVTTLPTLSTYKPTAGALPGGSTLLHLVDGLGGWGLILALAGLVLGAALWAIGAHSQNYQHSYVGRRAVLVSGAAALLIGAAPTLINFFFSTGHGIVNPL